MIPREKDGAVIAHPRRGFTTLELLVVISILLILAAIALPNLSAAFPFKQVTAELGGCVSTGRAEPNTRYYNPLVIRSFGNHGMDVYVCDS